MKHILESKTALYRSLNQIAETNGVVLFGSDFAAHIPAGELKQTFELDCTLYNRSLPGLSVFQADEVLGDCVLSLSPKKLLMQLGESDLQDGSHTVEEILTAYRSLIAKIQKAMPHCTIVLVSTCGTSAADHSFNEGVSALAQEMGCGFADVEEAAASSYPEIKAFSILKHFMTDRIGFYNAMRMLHVG